MSRFEKALERARSTRQTVGVPSGITMPEEAPADDLFEAPWSIADAAKPVDEAQARPVARPAARVAGQPAEAPRRAGTAIETAPSVPAPAAPARPDASAPAEASADILAAPIRSTLHFHADVAEKVVAYTKADHVIVEQYRKLAAALHQWQLEHGGKVVMVASAVASEGKTLTALNLALTLSGSYQRRVLLVDCDLRRPSVHDVLQIPPQPGLSEVAAKTPTAPRAVTERLSVVTAGRSTDDPVGTLTSSGMAALIEQGRRDYDWVLLDTPPAAVLPDASLLSDQTDGAVMVVAAGRTDYDMVMRAVASLGRDRILGVVLNGIDTRDMSVGKYQNYYYAQR